MMHKSGRNDTKNPGASCCQEDKTLVQERYLRDYIARKKESDELFDKSPADKYLEVVNSPEFRAASHFVNTARVKLERIMSKEEAFKWIKAWASGAGDGVE